MLIGAAFLPHPPIILPSQAGERGAEADQTIEAVRRACQWVASELHPDRIIISSPHPQHGFEVPLHFIAEAVGRIPPHQKILTSRDLPLDSYLELGETIAERERDSADRVAIIASGDCSHALDAGAPHGFHPAGAVLDEAIIAGLISGDPFRLLAIDPTIADAGQQCGLRSFIFALSALRPTQCEVLSYQAPYGVGYLVAIAGQSELLPLLQ